MAAGRQFSVDVLARSLVPTQYRNVCQASQQFVAANAGALGPCSATSTRTGRRVDGLRFADHLRNEWATLTADEMEMETLRAAAFIEADIDGPDRIVCPRQVSA